MGLFKRLFKRQSAKHPEEDYDIRLTDEYVEVRHPRQKAAHINWTEIEQIVVLTTDEGPWLPDLWLVLMSKEVSCQIPLGATGYDEVFDVISNFEGFNFDAYMKSAASASNARFEVWQRKE